jgi:TonB family protein
MFPPQNQEIPHGQAGSGRTTSEAEVPQWTIPVAAAAGGGVGAMYSRMTSGYAAMEAATSKIFAIGVTISVTAHFAFFAWNPSFGAGDMGVHGSELLAIELPPEIEIPPAPQTIARPATPVITSAPIDDNITIAPTTFEANPVANLPPPPVSSRSEPDLQAAPQFTPYTVRPELRNPDAIRLLLVRYYPSMMKDAGLGGTVMLWVFIDEHGVVQRALVNKTSGFPSLDEAALKVVPEMLFSPAIFRDKRVPVWIELPLYFTTIRGTGG